MHTHINSPLPLFKTFIKTYNVLNVADSNDENYIYLTIRQFQEEEVKTVKVQRNLANGIEITKDYEFTFRYTDKKVEENIETKVKLNAREEVDNVISKTILEFQTHG